MVKMLEMSQGYQKCNELSYLHNPGLEPLRALTVGKLLEQTSKRYGNRPAVISRAQNITMTFQQVLDQADKLAAGLRAIGLSVGDRIGIWAPNLAEWYVSHMACARGGYVLVNINPAYQPMEVEYCVNKVGVKCLICTHKYKSQNYYEALSRIAPEISKYEPWKFRCQSMPTLESIIFISDKELRGVYDYEDILNLATPENVMKIKFIQDKIDPDSACHIQFTSGTTGNAKAAIHTHFHLVNNPYYSGVRNELDRKHHIICLQVPMFHAFGTAIGICSALNHGATTVLPSPSYNPDKSLDAIRDEKCTTIFGTPTMYVDLVDRQMARNEDINPDIAVCAGASCSPHLLKKMKTVLRLKKVKSIYGLTECTAVVFQSLFDDDEYLSTSTVGYLGDHLEAKVIDSQGNIVPRGTPGELCIRGYSTTVGYWDDEEKTKSLIGKDKWLKTGDQFIIDQNGYARVVGRLKELIIRGGENIFPKEIEDFLNTHPDILESHVIGLPHTRLGEEVCACVRLRDNAAMDLNDIKDFCRDKMAYFKIPSVLRVMKSFPKTTSGKIQKYKLVQMICNENGK